MIVTLKIFQFIHIVFGSTGLITGLLNIIQKKGGEKHKFIGRIFYFSMLTTGFSSLVLTCLHPNYFLFMVGIFTLYMTSSGQQYINYKQKERRGAGKIGWAISIAMLLSGILFILLGIWAIMAANLFGLVFTTFGILGALFVYQDFLNFTGKTKTSNYWLNGHLQRMTGAFIASLTAFLVVNANYFPDIIPGFVFWLLPTIIFTPLIVKWSKKYQVKF